MKLIARILVKVFITKDLRGWDHKGWFRSHFPEKFKDQVDSIEITDDLSKDGIGSSSLLVDLVLPDETDTQIIDRFFAALSLPESVTAEKKILGIGKKARSAE